uniref:Integrase, catalytic region, zinc finger, CCHC-type, peptidase aspartic, catalytic n=1 Tax=Tanacetum cinerariifolium TaxID=118510 RepID=A0A699IMU8_TANCI|nr:hypothetical protein [Tanacetum cinerariifolium]
MDSMIPNGQRNTLAEYMILSGADNRLPMLDNDLKIQADCDMKTTNIILQGLPTEIYSLVNHHIVSKDLWERIQLLMQGDDSIACLNKAMDFLTAVAYSRFLSTNNQLKTSSNSRNQATIQDDPAILDGQAIQTIIPNNAAFQTEDLDTYDSDCDVSNAKAVLMANISNYGSDVILEVPHSETYLNDMENQSVHAMHDFEQSSVMDSTDNEISSDSIIIPYSQYFQKTQQATVQDTNLQAQQYLMILSVIEQMSKQMINHVNNWEKAIKEQNSESVTAELERYIEIVKTFEQRVNVDLSTHEK